MHASLVQDHSDARDGAAATDASAPPAPPATEPQSAGGVADERGARGGDSWEAVRRRYQARAAGDDPMAATAAREAWTAAGSAPAGLAGAGKGRVVRNAYGDEVVVE